MKTVAYITLLLVITAFLITQFYLRGENLTKYDVNTPVTYKTDPNSKGLKEVADYLSGTFHAETTGSEAEKLAARRAMLDASGLRRDFDVEYRDDVAEFDGTRVPGEWTIVPGADPKRRILYLHGGAFTIGSAKSHRGIIYNMASRTGSVVFAPNYRLMPENSRMDGIIDSQVAYRWILDNGPNGAAKADTTVVAGDSAGGNLTLMVINWARNEGLYQPTAAVAISPAVDSTYSASSFKGNIETDLMLKPMAESLAKIPNIVLLWGTWANSKMSTANPLISPIFDDLSGLPPTLVQASSAEILYDDARRYAEKRRVQGAPVTLTTWEHMPHVFQAFDQMLPEARQALDEIAAFLVKNDAGEKPTVTQAESIETTLQ